MIWIFTFYGRHIGTKIQYVYFDTFRNFDMMPFARDALET